ncbi:MAG: DNA-processing protein DprA [Bacteroidota bacterium]
MSYSSELYYQLALSRVENVGPKTGRYLIKELGLAEEVFHLPLKQLKKLKGVSEKTIRSIKSEKPIREAESILNYAEQTSLRILAFSDDHYPDRLKGFDIAPLILFVKGHIDLQRQRTVAVIGTRQASAEGIRQTKALVEGLQDYEAVIVSGLAYGIDIEAHKQSLKMGVPTVGVLGSGHEHIYPSIHEKIARQMVENGGLVSTYPFWQKPEREHFPARNRIVAMLSDCAVVVESGERGGSIITANMASELGKPVGACPGRGGHVHTAGCNAMIKAGQAEMIRSVADIAELLRWVPAEQTARQAKLFADLSPEEDQIVTQLKICEELAVDELRRKLNWSSAALAAQLLTMECKGLLEAKPGPAYSLSGLVAV